MENSFKTQYQNLTRAVDNNRKAYLSIGNKYQDVEGNVNYETMTDEDRFAMGEATAYINSDTFKLQVMQAMMPQRDNEVNTFLMDDVLKQKAPFVFCDATNVDTNEHFVDVCGELVPVDQEVLCPSEYHNIYTTNLTRMIQTGKVTMDMMQLNPNTVVTEMDSSSELNNMFTDDTSASLSNTSAKSK